MAAIIDILRNNKEKVYFIVFSLLFAVVVYWGTKTVNYFMFALPLVVIFGYFSLVDYKRLWYLTVFLMPLSITDSEFF